MKGKFVMVDGLDASGKSTIIHALENWAKSHNMKILNIENYFEEKKDFPTQEDLNNCDVIVSSEPTPFYVGKAIKEELVNQSERDYSVMSVAQAFALDREILYKRLLIPALKLGKFVFQEGGIVTSFIYQPVQGRISLNDLMHLPGNKLALENAPDLLIITKVDPEVVMQRIEQRNKKRSIFENLFFQRKLSERYYSMWLKQLFENFNSTVAYIDTNPPKLVDELSREVTALWDDFLKKKVASAQSGDVQEKNVL